MRISFRKLTIKNFKGVKDITIEFNGTITEILGANHTGKTTTADAIHWVLFGKNSDGATVFGIDPKDENNNIIHHLENSVELVMTADDRELTLMKVRRENWIKPKSHDEEVLDSHSTDCYIDGDKYTIKDYTAKIAELIPEAMFRAITNPAYFPSLKADDQRLLLVKMVGERSLEEVAGESEESEKFSELLKKMGGQDLKEYRQHLSYRMKELKKDIDAIPVRIEENNDALQKLDTKANFDFIRKRIEEIEKGIAQYDEQLKDATAKLNIDFDERMDQRKKVLEARTRKQEAASTVEAKNRQAKMDHDNEVAESQRSLNSIKREMEDTDSDIKDYTRRLEKLEKKMSEFREDWQRVESEEFTWEETEDKVTCPTCGQRLPEERITEIRKNAEQQFERKHMAEQDELDNRAAELKKSKADITALLNSARDKKKQLEQQLTTAEEYANGAKMTEPTVLNVEDDEAWQKASREEQEEQAKLDQMLERLSAANQSAEDESKRIEESKQQLMKTRDSLRDELAKEGQIERLKKRIKELGDKLVNLNQQLTNLEQEDACAESLEHATIEDLETRVNKLFKMVRFQMFATMLNGTTKPTCVLTMHGVPYQDLSNSEKINAGIDLINAMSKFNNTYAPIVVDNAESINEVLPSDSQQILLVVSRDPQLTIIK
ncbi:MAG: AAA family ATPase [Prevotella sp.]